MPNLLVVDDDDGIRASLTMVLEDEGYEVLAAASAEEGMEVVAARPDLDVLLVDLMLGGLDGFSFIRRVRPVCDAPVVVLSARQDASDVVAALEAGADDYVTKPFVVDVLLARLKALRRRARWAPAGPGTPVGQGVAAGRPGTAPGASGAPGTVLGTPPNRRVVLDAAGPLVLDVDAGTLRRGGDPVHLTVTEFRLLSELAACAGRLLSRADLLERVWERGYFGDERIVDVHVRRLRLKIETDPADPRLIATVRGLGYRLDVA